MSCYSRSSSIATRSLNHCQSVGSSCPVHRLESVLQSHFLSRPLISKFPSIHCRSCSIFFSLQGSPLQTGDLLIPSLIDRKSDDDSQSFADHLVYSAEIQSNLQCARVTDSEWSEPECNTTVRWRAAKNNTWPFVYCLWTSTGRTGDLKNPFRRQRGQQFERQINPFFFGRPQPVFTPSKVRLVFRHSLRQVSFLLSFTVHPSPIYPELMDKSVFDWWGSINSLISCHFPGEWNSR